MNDSLRPSPLETIALAAAALVLALQLFVAPAVGLADNGDFCRVTEPFGLTRPTEDPAEWQFSYVWMRYGVGASFVNGYASSVFVPLAAAYLPGVLLGGAKAFDLRALGLVYAALLVVALWLGLYGARELPAWARAVVAALAVLFATDVGYVATLNSFFGEPAAFVGLYLAVGAALALARSPGGRRGARLSAVYWAAALFVATSKPPFVTLAPVLAAVGLAFLPLAGPARSWRRANVAAACALLAVCAAYQAATPLWLRDIFEYQAVFVDILPNSPTPEDDLRALGVPAKYASLSGVQLFDPAAPRRDPTFRAEFFDRVDYLDLARFHAERPARLLDAGRRVAREAFVTRYEMLGNFERWTGAAPRARTDRFGAWSAWRARWLPHRLATLAGLLALQAIVAAAWLGVARPGADRARATLLLGVAACAASQFATTVVGQGDVDAARHLFLFNVAVDLALLFDAALLCALVAPLARAALARTRTGLFRRPRVASHGGAQAAPRSIRATGACYTPPFHVRR